MTALAAGTAIQTGQMKAEEMDLEGWPRLEIVRVEQRDNLDGGDWLGANRADFYAEVFVNGEEHTTDVIAKDDGEPEWVIPLDYTTRLSTIHVRLWDDDGAFERTDDHVDIDPDEDQKDLWFTYDRWTGKLSGDVEGWLNQEIVMMGDGEDSDQGRITFMIAK